MQDAQAHIEEKRQYTEKILREKTELASRLEEIQSKMEVEYSKSNFSVKELQVTVDTLKRENAQLVAELREYIGGEAELFISRALFHMNINYSGDKKSIIQDDSSVAPTEVSDSSRPFALEGIEIQFGGNLDKRWK